MATTKKELRVVYNRLNKFQKTLDSKIWEACFNEVYKLPMDEKKRFQKHKRNCKKQKVESNALTTVLHYVFNGFIDWQSIVIKECKKGYSEIREEVVNEIYEYYEETQTVAIQARDNGDGTVTLAPRVSEMTLYQLDDLLLTLLSF